MKSNKSFLISKLQEIGVIFAKGAEDTVAVIYKGWVIASGKVRIVFLQLRRALEKLKGKELEEYLDDLVDLAGMAENLATTKNVDLFLASAARLESFNITGKSALQYLDEALVHFNHYVVDDVVFKIGDENCFSVAQVVDDYLKTGKITKAKPITLTDIDDLPKIYGGNYSRITLPSLQNIMKEGERGIIWGKIKEVIKYHNGEPVKEIIGHFFNVIKKDGLLLYKDGQIGRDAIIGIKQYEEFKYLKTN